MSPASSWPHNKPRRPAPGRREWPARPVQGACPLGPPQEKPLASHHNVQSGFGTEGPRRAGSADRRPSGFRSPPQWRPTPQWATRCTDHSKAAVVAQLETHNACLPMAARDVICRLSQATRERQGGRAPMKRKQLRGTAAVTTVASRSIWPEHPKGSRSSRRSLQSRTHDGLTGLHTAEPSAPHPLDRRGHH
jgi:hypothetical protein